MALTPAESLSLLSNGNHQPKASFEYTPKDGTYLFDNSSPDRVIWSSQSNNKKEAIPAAYRCVNLLSGQLAMLRPQVKDESNMEPDERHPMSVLMKMPSRSLDPQQFWAMVLRSYFSQGNSYAWIRRDFSRRPIELVPATCNSVEWVKSRYAPYQRYRLRLLGDSVNNAAPDVEARSGDVITFHWHGYNGLKSPSPIAFAASCVLGLMDDVYNHQKEVLTSGLTSGSAFTTDVEQGGQVSYEEYQRVTTLIAEQMQQSRNSKKIPVLPPGVSIDRMEQLKSSDLEIVNLLKWGVEDVARVWGVSPFRLGHFHEGRRMPKFEEQAEDFERYTISEHAEMMKWQLTRKLLSAEDIIANKVIDVPTDLIRHGSMTERIIAAELAVARGGIMTINEGRGLIGLPPLPDGDRLYSPKGSPEQNENGEGNTNQEEDD